MVYEWVHAELSDETPVTAELRRMFKRLRDDYGKRSDADLTIEHLHLLTLSMRSNSELQP